MTKERDSEPIEFSKITETINWFHFSYFPNLENNRAYSTFAQMTIFGQIDAMKWKMLQFFFSSPTLLSLLFFIRCVSIDTR